MTDERRQALQIERASIIMIDCDLYASTKDALRFCSPAIQGSCVIFFDDWYPLAEQNLGRSERSTSGWRQTRPSPRVSSSTFRRVARRFSPCAAGNGQTCSSCRVF